MCMHLSVIRPSPKKLKTKIKSFRRGAIISAILRNFGQVRHSRVIDALTGRTIDDQPGADVRKSPLWFQVGEILSGNDALTSMPLRSSLLMVFDDYCLWGWPPIHLLVVTVSIVMFSRFADPNQQPLGLLPIRMSDGLLQRNLCCVLLCCKLAIVVKWMF